MSIAYLWVTLNSNRELSAPDGAYGALLGVFMLMDCLIIASLF